MSFFPQYDPFTNSLITASAFCSTYIMRPIGALIFGWIGDNIGRKATVVITTFMMAISCIIMANLPTYAQIGITASCVITICRVIQGMSSMGERIGAELYLTELIKPPIQYPAVTSVAICGTLGAVFALGIASIVTIQGFNWRIAFWIGAGVAIIGAIARTTLRETPEFADAKRRFKNIFEQHNENFGIAEKQSMSSEKVKFKTSFSLFLLQCSWPPAFYFAYVHCASILSSQFGYGSEQIINHNFIVSMMELFGLLVVGYISYYIYPLKILRVQIIIYTLFLLLCPYLLDNIHNPFHVLLIQAYVVLFVPGVAPAMPIFFKHFPVFSRFTQAGLAYALAKMFMYIVTSFGMVYLTNWLNNWGALIIMIPVCIGYAYALNYFVILEGSR